MIYFVRHGESEANVRGVFAGQRDNSLLTEKGKEQAIDTVNKIIEENIKIDRIISSPLVRAKETAQIIANKLGLEFTVDERIIEYDMGSLSGKPFGTISSKILIGATESENTKTFADRVFSCVKDLTKLEGNSLIVGHGGVLRLLETIKENIDPDLFYDIKLKPNASITEIDWIK